jgi:TRAP-type C4-dicarboxylate transport system substrate-binding protein
MSLALAAHSVASILAEGSGTMVGVKYRRAALVLAATATLAVAACGGGGGGEDKAGGSGGTVVLRLASTGGNIDQTPAVKYFVERVDERSGGNLRIEVVDEWAEFASDAEQQVVHAAAAGEVDLGWVGSRVFDTLGVDSFQALTAPMLIDGYALEDAVIESGITAEMMDGLETLGVLGLGVLADGLRRPVGVTTPILRPADWRGIRFGTLRSDGQVDAIRALGAEPVQIFGADRREALDNGRVQGFEFGLLLFSDPQWSSRAPYVAANVNLWPQMDVLLANQERLERLTAKQRGWLDDATQDAAARSAALVDTDAKALDVACQSGARFADASEADLAALQAAFEPVYANLRRHPETKAFIERIQALKQSTPPDPALSIPAECTGEAPERATGGTAKTPAYLNGTYRWVLTQTDADKVGDTDEGYPAVSTITLTDGRLEGGCFGADGGTYSVDRDRIMFHSIEYGTDSTVIFSRDDKGNLDLKPVPPIDPGDAFNCFYKPWTKID